MFMPDQKQFKRLPAKLVRTADALRSNAYARFKLTGRDLGLDFGQLDAFTRDALSHLPPDPYGRGDRNRRHLAAVYVPNERKMIPINRVYDGDKIWSIYHQTPLYNPEAGGVHRRFPALTEAQLSSPVLRAIIDFDFRLACLAGVLPASSVYIVGVHINQQAPKGGMPASVVPPFPHQDGEPVTCAHLLGRQNVTGGWTAVVELKHLGRQPDTIDPSGIRAKFTLEEAGESYVVDDCRVAHHADAVTATNPHKWGHRTMLLIDFRPMREMYTHDMKNEK